MGFLPVPSMKQMSESLWAVEQPKSIEMGMLKVGDGEGVCQVIRIYDYLHLDSSC